MESANYLRKGSLTLFTGLTFIAASVNTSNAAKPGDVEPLDRAQLRINAKPQPQNENTIFYDYVDKDGVLKGGMIRLSDDTALRFQVIGKPPAEAVSKVPYFVEKIIDNGPEENRVDLVFVGDGYTSGSLPDYANDVVAIVDDFFAETPLAEYRNYFNVHRVDVLSEESGVDNDPTQGVMRNTALDMGYWCANTERLLCVNTSKALDAASNAADVDQVLAVANSSKYGGAGYMSSNLGTLAGRNGGSVEIALHEFGHSFADLADEYDYGGNETYSGSEPAYANVSIYEYSTMSSLRTKWHSWLGDLGIDTFEGAYYSKFGIYRPSRNSKMRNLNNPFDAVSIEQFILTLYQTVSPIDSSTAPGSYPAGKILSVEAMQPLGHQLDVEWWVNGIKQSASGTEFNTAGVSGTVMVRVTDNTAAVRNETARASLMTAERSWTITKVNNADLAVTQTGVDGKFDPGSSTVSYQITLKNNGPDTANDIVLETLVTPLVASNQISIKSLSGLGCVASTGKCTISALASGSSFTAKVTVEVANEDVKFTAKTTVSSDSVDNISANNQTTEEYGGSFGIISLLLLSLLGLSRRFIR